MLPAACIGYVKNIAQPGFAAGVVDEGDALGAAPHIPAHFLIPEVVLGAGRGVGTLRKDKKLFRVRVLVEPGGRVQKFHPADMAAGDLRGGIPADLLIGLEFFLQIAYLPSSREGFFSFFGAALPGFFSWSATEGFFSFSCCTLRTRLINPSRMAGWASHT